MRLHKKRPTHVFANFAAGGVPAGVTEGVMASYIERQTGLPLLSLIDAVHSASAGTTIAAPLFLTDTNGHPRYTAQETLELFESNSQRWLEKPVPYLRQHIGQIKNRIPLFSGRNNSPHLLDDQIVERTLSYYLKGANLSELKRTFTISAHNITASPEENAVHLGKFIDHNGRATYNPSPKTSVSDLLRASMAVPGHYRSKHVKGIGYLQDFGHVYDAHVAFAKYKNTLDHDANVTFIEFGTPRHAHGLTPKELDNCSLLQMILNSHLMRGTSNHSYSMGMQTVNLLINGNGRLFNLTPHITASIRDTMRVPSENILDATSSTLKNITTFAEEHVFENRKKFDRLCDILVENHELKFAKSHDVFFPLRAIQNGIGKIGDVFKNTDKTPVIALSPISQ